MGLYIYMARTLLGEDITREGREEEGEEGAGDRRRMEASVESGG